MATGTLSGKGKALFEKVYNASKDAGDSPEIAARKAWSAVKSAGWSKNKDGEWVKGKADVFQEFSMAVSKVSFDKATQERNITLVASDTDPDLSTERMSTHLFQDFVDRIENQTPVPEEFRSVICEDGWCGGMPYLSISHYKSAGGRNVPGEIRVSYVDGNRFKSKAVLHDNALGKAVFKSLNDDLTGKSTFDDKVRVSIGFLDLAHKHGDYLFERKSLTDVCPKCAEGEGDKEYWEGVLVHEAFTRKPMNPRTDVEVQRMAIMTKKDDAESIVGKEVLAELDLEAKSQLEDDLVVVKSENLEERVYKVREAFFSQFAPPPEPQPYNYVHSVMNDSAIVCYEGKMYKAGYSLDGDEVKFEKKSSWQEVEMGFIAVKSEAAPLWRSDWYLRVSTPDGKISSDLLNIAKSTVSDEHELSELKFIAEKAGIRWTSEEEMPEPEKVIDEVKEPEVPETPAVEEPKTEPVAPVVEETAVDKAVAVLRSKLLEVKSRGISGEPALVEIQPIFNELGNAVKSELTPKADPATANIAEIVRSAVAEQMAQIVAPLQAEIAELRMKSGVATMQKRDEGVVARSVTLRPPLPNATAPSPAMSKIQQLAWKSTE